MSTESNLESQLREYKILSVDFDQKLNDVGIKDYWYIQSKPKVEETVFSRILKDVTAYFMFFMVYVIVLLINGKTINEDFKKYSETPDAKIDGIVYIIIALSFLLLLLSIVISKIINSVKTTKINNDWSDHLNHSGVVDHFDSEIECNDAVSKLIVNDNFYIHIKGKHTSLKS
jgi:hypothetical protein